MQIRRFPVRLAVVVLALIAALLIGGALGYTLKPLPVVNDSTRLVVVHDGATSNPNDFGCIVVDGHKGC